MNIILLGYPGSGKGTQAKILVEKLQLLHIATGDIFREEIGKKTPLGLEVSNYLSSGKLVPDNLVMEVIKSRLNNETKGVLFDGFPRTVDQAEALDNYFEQTGRRIEAVIFLNIVEQEVIQRMSARRTCPKCGKIYNLITNPPKSLNVCDECRVELIIREDDKVGVIEKRLMVYRDLTEPLISYYKTNNIFFEVDGKDSPDIVSDRIMSFLKNKVLKNG
jgi:adenylate kinase